MYIRYPFNLRFKFQMRTSVLSSGFDEDRERISSSINALLRESTIALFNFFCPQIS